MPNAQNVVAPVLIVGAARSGSSWLLDVLNRHSQVQGLIENRIVETLYHELFHSFWTVNMEWVCDAVEHRRRAVAAVRSALCAFFPGEERVWAMKLLSRGRPWDFVFECFPEARYVHLVRSATTAIPSMMEFVGKEYPVWQELELAEHEYAAAHQEALALRALGKPYLMLRQEDIARDPEAAWESVRAFIGLPDEPMHELDREVNAAPSTRGNVRRGRPPLLWTQLSREVMAVSQELGYLPCEPGDGRADRPLLSGLEAQVAQLKAEVAALESERGGLRGRVRELERRIAAMVEPVRALSAHADRLGAGDLHRLLAPAERAADAALGALAERDHAVHGGDPPRRLEVRRVLPCVRRFGSGEAQLEQVDLLDREGRSCRTFTLGDRIVIAAALRAWTPIDHVAVSFLVRDETGVDLLGTTTFDERLALPDLPAEDGIEVRFALENRLRMGLFAVSIAVVRVTRQDYADVALLDQADDCLTFRVTRHPERPVHYKVHEPVTIEWRALPPASG